MRLFARLSVYLSVILLTACGGGGGGGSAPEPAPTPAPTPAPPAGPTRYYPSAISGKAIDGYLSNATVWIDENFDFVRQEEELTAITEEGGSFALDPTQRLLDLGYIELVPEPTPEPTP